MAKIRLSDLARKMGIPNQDLVFKLKAIGVRVDDEDAMIDASVIQAILEGKRLPQPREVILRDEESQPAAPSPAKRRPPQRRLPPNMLRPSRRRTMIQRVEPRIKTIPVPPRPEPRKPEEARPEKAAKAAPATEKAAAAKPERVRAPKSTEKEAAQARGKPRPALEEDEDLRSYRGVLVDDEGVEEAVEGGQPEVSSRGKRRAERRKKRQEEGAKVLPFKSARPEAPITVTEAMTVRDFAEKLGVKTRDLMALLLGRGIMATINHILEPELAIAIAEELGVEAVAVSFEEEVQLQQEQEREAEEAASEPRAPVVTIMGHVDHGKTTLLDAIRSSRVVEAEFGGITQHIGAYSVETEDRRIVFLDTPGHEAFTLMRARGARATDIVVLVVAADDGVMPQTAEAIDHARAANVPLVIAINKIDKPNANLDRVKTQLSEHDLTVEDWGGDTVAVPISAKEGEGLYQLLEMIGLTADLLELKASPGLPAHGVVLEARKEKGRGILATVLVQDGTLSPGDVFVTGATWGRVRSMIDDLGEKVEAAGPATPVEVSGFQDLPGAGEVFQVVEDESKARSIAEFRAQEQRQRQLSPSHGRLSLDQLFDQIQEGRVKELPIVLKADVQGSVEVLVDTLTKLSTDKVKIQIIHAAAGAITTNDVLLASASDAVIVGFNVRPERNAAELADKEEVDVRLHTVIYELSDELRRAMTGLLEPTYREVEAGRAEVRETFSLPKIGVVAGSHVVEGTIPRNAKVRVLRDNVVVHEGQISSLRRFKEDVSEVRSGFDCGIRLERFQDVKPGDIIEAYIEEEVAPTL